MFHWTPCCTHRDRHANRHRTGIACLLLLFSATAAAGGQTEAGQLPAESLAAWYKPQNKRQVWLHTMFALRRELQAVEEYGASGDLLRLEKWSARLAKHYRSIPEMVPEWGDEIELEAVTRLEQAAAKGDAPAALTAASGLARTCRSCHREFRALAAARFRAPDFSPLTVADGRDSEIPYPDFMETLSRDVNRIKIATEDDRWDAAMESASVLRSQLQRLGETCNACHPDAPPKERILGSATDEILNRLDRELGQRDPKAAGRTLGEAAVNVCARCHGVHRTLSDLRDHIFD